jgi:hypothetical protein
MTVSLFELKRERFEPVQVSKANGGSAERGRAQMLASSVNTKKIHLTHYLRRFAKNSASILSSRLIRLGAG